ncbi:InlB B-repeat-containing protein [Breznakiella homolactica]|uniref:Leucine-rich repeat protein n=1 Tax=Breznakiella homolactica TaxID=2798577 RepID=A0A7T7XLW7_9SPIR|nr:InlB B-repeat-containing protein [Breznakiella homolactica]QQO08663.1 InlB B-repeat-containing protein [Breznakiella homolactica]
MLLSGLLFGCSSPSSGGKDDPVLPAPNSPQIISADGQLSIIWDAVTGAVSYDVYLNDENTLSGAVELTTTQTEIIFDGLDNDTVYYVWLDYNTAGASSSISSPATGTPSTAVAPPATPVISFVKAFDSAFLVRWGSVPGATSYQVSINDSNTLTGATVKNTKLFQLIFNGLSNGTTYYIWISAVNTAGASTQSNPVTVIPVAGTISVPDAPSDLAITVQDDTNPEVISLNLTWTNNATNATLLKLYNSRIFIKRLEPTETSVQVYQSRGQKMAYYIVALNSAGESLHETARVYTSPWYVNFNSAGGSAVPSQNVLPGKKITKPADPALSPQTFLAWYKDNSYSTLWNFDTNTVTSNTTLYARWSSDSSWFNTAPSGGDLVITGLSTAWENSTNTGKNNIVIPASIGGNTVIRIEDYAFDNRTTLLSINIPTTITAIGNYAFANCTALTSLNCFSATPPAVGSNMFSNNTPKLRIYVPSQSVPQYKTSWAAYASIIVSQ